MTTVQITAKVNTEVKKAFMKAAKAYDLPASSLLSMMMRSVAEGKRMPEMGSGANEARDTVLTPALKKAIQKGEAEYRAGKTISLHQLMREE